MSANKRPLISFIITYYNLPTDMLVKCTDSILALPLGNDDREIILIDDGSDTSPLDALDERNKLIKYIRQQNAGLSAARNKGIEAAQGDYIQFVDGDDMLLTEPYKLCLDTIRQDKPDMLMFKMTNDNKHYHIDEGHTLRTNGAQYMTRHNLRKVAQMAHNVWRVTPTGNDLADALEGIRLFKDFLHRIGMPVTFAELGVPAPDIDALVENLHLHKGNPIGSYFPLTPADTKAIYTLALGDGG